MGLNAYFSRRTVAFTVFGLGASYLLLKSTSARPQTQQRPSGDYRVETHRSGEESRVADPTRTQTNAARVMERLLAAGIVGGEDEKSKKKDEDVNNTDQWD